MSTKKITVELMDGLTFVNLEAPKTAQSKMNAKGFLSRTTLAKWLQGSLGCYNELLAVALYKAKEQKADCVWYGNIQINVEQVKKHLHSLEYVCSACVFKNGGLIECYFSVFYDFGKKGSVLHCDRFLPMTKNDYNSQINYIDNEYVPFVAVGYNFTDEDIIK